MSFKQPKGLILMFHRINHRNTQNIDYNEDLKISPECLENTIRELRAQNYRIISFDELVSDKNAGRLTYNYCILTFDDGYKDVVEYGYPILSKYKVPFTVYVSNSFIENKGFLWWQLLEDLVLQNDKIDLTNGTTYSLASYSEKKKCFIDLRYKILEKCDQNIQRYFNDLFKDYLKNLDLKNYFSAKWCLNKDELLHLSQDNLATLGFHTRNHLVLKNLNDEELADEIPIAKQQLEENLRLDLNHFAYPFGTPNEIDERVSTYVKQLKMFQTISTTDYSTMHGSNFDLNSLPRIYFTEKTNIKELL